MGLTARKEEPGELARVQQMAAIVPTMTRDEVLARQTMVQGMLSRLREIKADMDAGIIEWIEANGDLVVDENTRYYVGKETKYKCKDLRATIEMLLCGFSVEDLVTVLSANAIKAGALKKMIGNFDDHFETVVTPDLKTGRPKKTLAKTFSQ